MRKHMVTVARKTPFNRKKPQAEPDSEWAAICLDLLGLRGERGRMGEGKSTLKLEGPGLESVIGTSTVPDYL